MCAPVNQVLEFLAHQHGDGLGFSGVNTAKSAVLMFLSASTKRKDYEDYVDYSKVYEMCLCS